jgi:peptide/nickel transport system ATP-binding protein
MPPPAIFITRLPKGKPMPLDDVLLQVKGLRKHFPIRKGFLKRSAGAVKAVDGVDLTIRKGETIGLVGESGCGKSTLGRSILRLIEPTDGEILFRSQVLADEAGEAMIDVAQLRPAKMKRLRREMQIIFQDPYSSLDPRMNVGDIVGEPLRIQGILNRSERHDRVMRLLEAVGLGPDHAKRFPHEFSGGQRQRIGIARALALNPRFIVADEPVSALDVSIQAQVVNLMQDLQAELGLTYLFVAHDLSVVRHISNRVAVMYLGRIVEIGDCEAIFSRPQHPYTEALLSAVPIPDPDSTRQRIRLKGDVPSASSPPSGCPFHPRCAYATSLCREHVPHLRDAGRAQQASCHRIEELNLSGVS